MRDRDCSTGRAKNLYKQIYVEIKTEKFRVKLSKFVLICIGYNLCKFFCNKKEKSSDFPLKEIRCKGLRLDHARTDLIFTDLSRSDQIATLSRIWNSNFLVASRLDCFDSSRLELLTAWLFVELQGFFFTWKRSPNESPELSIYRAQECSF